MLAVVHDLAEAVAGDIAPWEAGISKEDKIARERVSIEYCGDSFLKSSDT